LKLHFRHRALLREVEIGDELVNVVVDFNKRLLQVLHNGCFRLIDLLVGENTRVDRFGCLHNARKLRVKLHSRAVGMRRAVVGENCWLRRWRAGLLNKDGRGSKRLLRW